MNKKKQAKLAKPAKQVLGVQGNVARARIYSFGQRQTDKSISVEPKFGSIRVELQTIADLDEITLNLNNRSVNIPRNKSYKSELKLGTVLRVVDFISENNIDRIEIITRSIEGLDPITVGKSLVTLEQNGLIELNVNRGVIKKLK